jgi:hypothetical protein
VSLRVDDEHATANGVTLPAEMAKPPERAGRSRRLPDKGSEVAIDLAIIRWEPDLAECRDKALWPIEVAEGCILDVWTTEDQENRLVAFQMMLKVRGELGDWHTVVRMCTKHGFGHLHRYRRDGKHPDPVEIFPITGAHDVEAGYYESMSALIENAEEYARGWDL